jgi:proline iminopeptidase
MMKSASVLAIFALFLVACSRPNESPEKTKPGTKRATPKKSEAGPGSKTVLRIEPPSKPGPAQKAEATTQTEVAKKPTPTPRPPAFAKKGLESEGLIPVTGGRVWYRIIGSTDAAPLLIIHGGPGLPHNYLEPLQRLCEERPVIFYDQLGCGQSDRTNDPKLWQVGRFVDEVARLRTALGATRIHVLGHGWGTIVATEYALKKPEGLLSLTLMSPWMSIPRLTADAKKLLAELPQDLQDAIKKHGEAGTTTSPEYLAAMQEFQTRFVCRILPTPGPLARAEAALGLPVMKAMIGPDLFTDGGNLKDFDNTKRLREITVPTLLPAGRWGNPNADTVYWYHDQMPGSEMAVLENSADMPQFEDLDRCLEVIGNFLRRVDEKPQ